MTLLTLTTVGFASGSHLSTGVLVFTAGLALLGVGLFFVILGLAATAIVEGRVSLFSRSRRMRCALMNYADTSSSAPTAGLGRSIARELEAGGVPFVVVDSKAELEPDLERDGRCYLIGDASDEAVLREAGIERAQGLICAVDSDAENVYITIVARSLSPDLLIVARAAREQSADRLYRAGATHVVSPYVTSGRRMANLAVRPHVVEFFDLALARWRARPAAGGTGDQPKGPRWQAEACRSCAGLAVPSLVRHPDGQLIANPARDLQLQAGDVLVVFGEVSDLNPLDREHTGTSTGPVTLRLIAAHLIAPDRPARRAR